MSGMPLSPFLLQAQIALPVNGGSAGLADTTRLENPFQAPMWVDEIQMTLAGTEAASLWEGVRIQFELGRVSLTNGFIPVGNLGKVLTDAQINSGDLSTLIFTWKLPKPLFVAAREFIRPSVYFVPNSGNAAKTVTIVYRCRPLPKRTPTPKRLQIPWVTFFQPPDLTAGTVDRTDQSSPSDLYNPFDQDLHVQRFIGRFGQVENELNNNMDLASVLTNLTTGALITGTLVSAQDSFNNILIRDPTPFAHVFDSIDRSWTVSSCILPPKGFYLFTVDRLWAGDVSGSNRVASVAISMIGWREVEFISS